MSRFLNITKGLLEGKSITRILLNDRLKSETLIGNTIDIGGGRNADYISFMPKAEDVNFLSFDIKNGAEIDFEKDSLPSKNGAYDTVLFLNVMEHIFNYQHIANEVTRIVKPGGQLLGFVPFLMWYHPDHSDFFRYTHEALEKIFNTAGATSCKIEVVGAGPFLAAAQMVIQSFPKILRPVVFGFIYTFEKLYQLGKGKNAREYALGYYFKVEK